MHDGILVLKAEVPQAPTDGEVPLYPAPADVAPSFPDPTILLLVIGLVVVAEGDGFTSCLGVNGAGVSSVGANYAIGGEYDSNGRGTGVLIIWWTGRAGVLD